MSSNNHGGIIMTNISLVNSSLFSSNNSSISSSSNNTGLSSLLGDYAAIKNGSYKMLVKKYYAINKSESVEDSETKSLASTRQDADSLEKTINELKSMGTDSLFKETEVKNENGSVTKQYDMDAIYKKVSEFVSGYNDLLDSSSDVDNTSVLKSTLRMVSATKSNTNLLSKVGITIGSDNKLAIDETKFKSATMSDVKSLFQGSSSYVADIADKASSISSIAKKASLASNSLYNSSGSYSNLTTGTLFDSIF